MTLGVQVVKRTVELYECDKCGEDATRYQVVFEDATLVLDRCDRHNRMLEKLREEKGEWVSNRTGTRQTFKKSTLAEIRQQLGEESRPPTSDPPVTDDSVVIALH